MSTVSGRSVGTKILGLVPCVNIGDTGGRSCGRVGTWNARVETCEPRITNDLRIGLMKGGPCVGVPRDWRIVGGQVVVMSDLRVSDNCDNYRMSFR